MLRLIPTAAHSVADVEETIAAFRAVKDKLTNGEYQKHQVADLSLG
jgi:glycine C-acetyltransferase